MLRQTQAAVRTNAPNWQPWVTFFLNSLCSQVKRVEVKIKREQLMLATLQQLSVRILLIAREQGRGDFDKRSIEHPRPTATPFGCTSENTSRQGRLSSMVLDAAPGTAPSSGLLDTNRANHRQISQPHQHIPSIFKVRIPLLTAEEKSFATLARSSELIR